MDGQVELPIAGTDAPGSTQDDTQAAAASSKRRARKDALVYLREFIIAKKTIHYQDDWLDFDGHKVHKSAKCAYALQGGSLIDVGSVWLMFEKTSADRSYTQAETKAMGFTYIGIDRRGDLCDFLLGKTETCRGLNKDVWSGKKRPRDQSPRLRRKVDKSGEATLEDTLSYEDVSKRVRCVQDLDVVIRRPGKMVPNANMILKIAQEEWTALSNGIRSDSPSKSRTKGPVPLYMELEQLLRKNPKANPIFVVPMNKSAPVNLLNAQELLQFGTYKEPDKEHIAFFESTRSESVEVKRNINGKLWTFEVRDSVKNFSKEEWLRTVLVITDGNEWQFKGWPFETVVDLFSVIKGVYFHDTGKPLPTHVYNWPCLKLPIPTSSAHHRFAQLRDDIFNHLEEFMNSTRPMKFVNESKLGGGRRMVEMMKNIL